MASIYLSEEGERIVEIAPNGPTLSSDRDAVDLIGDAIGNQANIVLLPIARLDDAFFDLSHRIAGEFLQKFVNYGIHVMIVGDISQRTTASKSLRDFVYEANRGDQIWFLSSKEALEQRLAGARKNPIRLSQRSNSA